MSLNVTAIALAADNVTDVLTEVELLGIVAKRGFAHVVVKSDPAALSNREEVFSGVVVLVLE